MGEQAAEAVLEDQELEKELYAATDEAAQQAQEEAAAESESEQSETDNSAQTEESSGDNDNAGAQTEVEGQDVSTEEGQQGQATEEGQQSEEQSQSESEVSDIDSDLVTRAVRAGLSLNEAQSFTDAEALTGIVEKLESAQQSAENGQQQEGESQENQAEEDPLADLPELNEEEYDPDVAKLVNGLKNVVRQQNETIKNLQNPNQQGEQQQEGQQQEGQNNQQGQQQAEDNTQWFDNQVNNLGDDYKQIFGEGKVDDLDPNSAEFQRRAELADRMNDLLAGYQANGKNVSYDAVFNEAIEDVAGKVQQQLAQRSEQHSNRPGTTRAQPQKDPEDETADLIDQKFGS